MAVLAQAVSVGSEVVAFAGLPTPRDNNFFPRARIVFRGATSISAKAMGNTKIVTITCSLPVNYAYRIDTIALRIGTADLTAEHYVNLADAVVNDGTGDLSMFRLDAQADITGQSGVAGIKY